MDERARSRWQELETRFNDLVSRCAPDADAASLYETIADKYSEPHRRYHTLEHIQHCLSQLDEARHLADDPDAIELALWFHDLIYDPTADDNERRSAETFDSLLGALMPAERAVHVRRLIVDTEYPSEPGDRDGKLMVDIDLSSFALPWDQFMRDTEDIRSEYSHVPEKQFYAGKLKFLDKLLSRPRFYLTDHFHDRLESQARANIERHIREVRENH